MQRKAGQDCQIGKGKLRRALVRIPTERTNSIRASRRAVFPRNSNRLPLAHRAWYTPSRLQVPRTAKVAFRSCLTLNSSTDNRSHVNPLLVTPSTLRGEIVMTKTTRRDFLQKASFVTAGGLLAACAAPAAPATDGDGGAAPVQEALELRVGSIAGIVTEGLQAQADLYMEENPHISVTIDVLADEQYQQAFLLFSSEDTPESASPPSHWGSRPRSRCSLTSSLRRASAAIGAAFRKGNKAGTSACFAGDTLCPRYSTAIAGVVKPRLGPYCPNGWPTRVPSQRVSVPANRQGSGRRRRGDRRAGPSAHR